ncbi:MAG: hypothetical protein LBQ18_08600 [Campylobacteraceae bacterium]|jgi:hypothetical protein|nr:hypothetical protein [Campylobacteraceae bacterium]
MAKEFLEEGVSVNAARQLTNTTKTTAQFESLTPKWLTRLIDWKALDSALYRVNKVKEDSSLLEALCNEKDPEAPIPQGFIDYETKPRLYELKSVSTILQVKTAIADLYSDPYDQTDEQIRLTVESLKERQESELINNDDYGLLKNIHDSQRIQTRDGAPTPDDLDELISKVWKEPSFFLAHPRAIAAFGRECTRRGVPPPTISLYGTQFLTWRGIPLVPTNKLFVDGLKEPKGKAGKTNILLIRTGEKKQGVVGLYQNDVPNQHSRGLSVRFMGVNERAIASYLLSIYCSAAILSKDAIAVLEDVDVGNYYEYR